MGLQARRPPEARPRVHLPAPSPPLRTLKMEEKEPRPRWSDVSLTCALFPLLLCIPAPENVEVRFDASPLWVGDGDIAQLAASWPHLRRLVLTCHTNLNAANRCASIGALGHLAAGCRDLEEVVLPRVRLDDSDTLARAGSQTASTGSNLQSDLDDTTPCGLVGMDVDQGTAHPLRSLSVACPTSGTVSGDRCIALGCEMDVLFSEPDMQTLSAKRADSGQPRDWYMLSRARRLLELLGLHSNGGTISVITERRVCNDSDRG
ncbi:hypothetical protein C8Q80DRAFT_199836 [Daedaleopsis nitida]|nr:hypothetical protein C8Q80DRAFT_199836 [Daedaleopsis nitida]